MAIEKFYKESILVGPQENEAWKYESGGNLLVFVKDTLRAQVEATSGGRLTVLYDDQGSPSIMYVLPRFKLEDIDSNLGSGWHPAFLVNGVEKTEIFIGAFEACVINNRACSLPGQDPKVYVNFDDARSYCTNKGTGWHLMTIFEWAAVMLWCLKNGFQPRGNTDYGKSNEAAYETAKVTYIYDSTQGRTATGTGPKSWFHNNDYVGIADLVGNVWEWLDLFKLVDGRIYCPSDNYYSLAEASWTAQDAYFDRESADVNNPILSSARNISDEGQTTNYSTHDPWRTLILESTFTAPDLLKQICVSPKTTESGGTLTIFSEAKGKIWTKNFGERVARRGGYWSHGADAGLGALALLDARSDSGDFVGFRPAYIG